MDIKAIIKAKTYKKIGKRYKSYEDFDKAFEEIWNTMIIRGNKKEDGKLSE